MGHLSHKNKKQEVFMGKRIGEVKRELGISENTIRNLERRGLIHPVRSLAGYRLFTEDEIQKIREIYRQPAEVK
jgi:DNA-binding transcriptional MerR regulator